MHHVIYDHHADSAITGTPVSSWVVHMNGLVAPKGPANNT